MAILQFFSHADYQDMIHAKNYEKLCKFVKGPLSVPFSGHSVY